MPKGAVNVHASLLPKYRGAAPINWAIMNGEKQTGISIITVGEKMDAGDIIAQAVTDIDPDETAGELGDRLAGLAAPLLVEILDLIDKGKATYKPQDHSKATRAPKLKKSDGFLDFNETAETIRRRILGLWPWPGATANYISKKTGKSWRVIIGQAQIICSDNPDKLPAGTVDKDLNIICGRDALKITKIKTAGGCLMNFTDFVHGRCCSKGDIFLKVEE
jgi:methionyl-tRNA formyltransferase